LNISLVDFIYNGNFNFKNQFQLLGFQVNTFNRTVVLQFQFNRGFIVRLAAATKP
jgi:hypothetical protein